MTAERGDRKNMQQQACPWLFNIGSEVKEFVYGRLRVLIQTSKWKCLDLNAVLPDSQTIFLFTEPSSGRSMLCHLGK